MIKKWEKELNHSDLKITLQETKEQLIYKEVKTVTPQSNQTKITRTESHKEKGSSVPFPWLFTVVILGIFCFLLLLTTGILGFMGKLNKPCSPSPPEKFIAGILGLICLVLASILLTVIIVTPLIHNRSSECHCGHCPRDWLTYSNNCYYTSLEKKSWNESVRSCATKNSTLLYIDNEEETKFLMSLSITSWIPVSREGRGHSWMWLNGSTCKLQIRDYLPGECNCAVQDLWSIRSEDCQAPNAYNCKPKLEN
ncbi:hypothetical protein G4228_014562 [Cervus hanglu yarkandensis]|nr:hypothetical protein G4228_014562 [Cervus hanglu yarkandensis]